MSLNLVHKSRIPMLILTVVWMAGLTPDVLAQDGGAPGRRTPATQPVAADARPAPPNAESNTNSAKRGLILSTKEAFGGYTLFAPMNSTTTYLVDMEGKLAHSWPSKYAPGQAVYLLDDGSVLRSEQEPGMRNFGGGGIGGRIQRIAPDGKLIWDFVYANDTHCQHHDIRPMPNGNVLLIAWEKKTRDEVLAAGGDPQAFSSEQLWPDSIVEVQPEGATSGKIVWEWHVWDHLVQEFDKSKANYGVVAEHPERIDLNYRQRAPRESRQELARLRSLGYVGGAEAEEEKDDEGPPPAGPGRGMGPGPGGFGMQTDWCHTNAVDYNAKLDQIALSVHNFNEIWIIDHSTSMKEAASHTGGRSGRGGDLLYRWGNPRAYGAGGAEDQVLFAQHDVQWIADGSPGAGHLTIFNNGTGRPGEPYSSIVEVAPPIGADGRYRLEPGQAYGPAKPTWEYTARNKGDFFASHISGAQRLPNGNTLICSGEEGRLFEVSADGQTVWDFVNPYAERGGPGGMFGMFGGPPPRIRPGEGGPPGPPQAEASATQPATSAPAGPDERGTDRRPPAGERRRFPGPGAGPGGWRAPFGGPGGPRGGPGGGLFRATRFAPDYPGVRRALEAGRTAAANPQ